MEEQISAPLTTHFGKMTDPRGERTKLHPLFDILVIAICAILAGADHWEDVADFGQAKQAWFETFLELPHGIPSHDPFKRVFARLDPQEFQASFLRWVKAVRPHIGEQVLAIDGKVLRRSHDRGLGQAAIDMVSAWACAKRLVLGQVKVDDKSNEITAIPALLQGLEVAGCIVTMDAIGCQTEIAETIIDKQAAYVLALKENQGRLFEDVQLLFADLEKSQYKAYAFDDTKTLDKNHGRLEIRECWTISDPESLCHLRGFANWKNLGTVSHIRSQRQVGTEKSCEDRYHLASLVGAKRILGAVRSHWGMENEVHWTLDMAFDEDHCRVRKDHGPQNFAMLRHIALNGVRRRTQLKQEKTAQRGIKGKRLLAAWNEDYLLKVLAGVIQMGN